MSATTDSSFLVSIFKRRCVAGITLACLVLFAGAMVARHHDLPIVTAARAHHTAATAGGFASLPLAAQARISAALGRDLPAYQAWAQGNGFHAENERHGLATDFTAAGVEVRNGTAFWKLTLLGYGHGDALKPVHTTVPYVDLNRVEYRRGPLTEWYVNGPLGLEQGFTLDRPPSGRGTARRTLTPSQDAKSVEGTQSVGRERVGQAP